MKDVDRLIQALKDQIAEQIELIAQLICENKSAVEAEAKLESLEKQLVQAKYRAGKI